MKIALQAPVGFVLRCALALAALLLVTAASLDAQTGRLVGRVQDVGSGGPISGAQVFIEAGPGTLTDLNGRFVLTGVEPGTHVVSVQMLGYADKTVTGVDISAGGTAQLDIGLEESAVEIEGITVSADRERGSTAALLDQRRTSDALVEAVGSVEIGRRPDADAADVAQRMTGVTVEEGKYVFIRGLGERYSQTTLDGSSLPSPEPDKEVVPLDLFPSSFLESLETQKSYTPDLPADFSGGTVSIRTKDFPNEFTVKLGVGTSFNTVSAFSDEYLEVPGAGVGFFGFDDGSRQLPDALVGFIGGIRGPPLASDAETRIAAGRAFQQNALPFTPVAGETPLNRSFDLSVGGSRGVLEDGEIGYVVAGTYSDQYDLRLDEVERKYFTTAFEPTTPEGLRLANVDYDFRRGTRNIGWGTIGNFTFKPTPTQKLSLRTTTSMNSEQEARIFEGLNSEDIGGEIRSTRARFVERLLLWSQLAGEHQIPLAGSRVDWRVTAARAERDEPYLREATYVEDDGEFLLLGGDTSGRVFFSQLTDDDLSAELDWTIPFSFGEEGASLKVGGAYRSRTRDFGARRFRYDFLGSLLTDIDEALDTAQIVAQVRNPGEFALDERPEPGDLYDVSDDRVGGYAMMDVPLGSSLRSVFGARVEQYDLRLVTRIAGRDSVFADRTETDVAPSLSLIWSPSTDTKVRAAASRTADRPEFRELAPFQFTEAASLRQVLGNPALEPADITSADLRWDWFISPGELLSFGGFFKHLDTPIELVYLGAASSAYQYTNAVDATLIGLELDATVRMGRLVDRLENFTWQGNLSWIESEVSVEQIGAFNPTNTERPLVGQAPYVLNTGVSWVSPAGFGAGVFFNRFGERLEAAGGEGVPDIYEQPRNGLDATLSVPLPGDVRVKIKGSNLLNDPYRYEQSANGITLVQREYEVGTNLSIGLSWEF